MDFLIRKIERSNIGAIILMLREFAEYENLSEYCTATEERFQTAMFGAEAVVEGLIAFAGDEPAGYALFYPNFSSFRGQRGLFLDDLFVRSSHRGSGLGLKLLKTIAGIAKARNLERIDFLVLDGNEPAIKFYRKLGAENNCDEMHFKFSDTALEGLAANS